MTKIEIDKKIDDIINFSELGEYIYEPIQTYSSGMSMRLAFSIAIFSEPQILIVDEALSVGDAYFQAKCISALKKRKEENMSIIYVSHDLNSLKLLCDRMILLNRGKVIEEGSPEDVINSYNFLIAKLNDNKDILKRKNFDINSSSFGTFDVEIKEVNLKQNNKIVKKILTGSIVNIEVKFFSKINLENLTIGIHIRDKYGQDIYGTNTFFQKKIVKIEANSSYICIYSMKLNIGVGKYTLGVALHTDDWHTNRCFHWVDNIINFEILMDKDNSFIGLCKLEPNIKILKGDKYEFKR
jgi:lipopolysaccharide transport system ATP-binding protein